MTFKPFKFLPFGNSRPSAPSGSESVGNGIESSALDSLPKNAFGDEADILFEFLDEADRRPNSRNGDGNSPIQLFGDRDTN